LSRHADPALRLGPGLDLAPFPPRPGAVRRPHGARDAAAPRPRRAPAGAALALHVPVVLRLYPAPRPLFGPWRRRLARARPPAVHRGVSVPPAGPLLPHVRLAARILGRLAGLLRLHAGGGQRLDEVRARLRSGQRDASHGRRRAAPPDGARARGRGGTALNG